ncbi:hypothetical protein PG990_004280 [Apiospora arundinis]
MAPLLLRVSPEIHDGYEVSGILILCIMLAGFLWGVYTWRKDKKEDARKHNEVMSELRVKLADAKTEIAELQDRCKRLDDLRAADREYVTAGTSQMHDEIRAVRSDFLLRERNGWKSQIPPPIPLPPPFNLLSPPPAPSISVDIVPVDYLVSTHVELTMNHGISRSPERNAEIPHA